MKILIIFFVFFAAISHATEFNFPDGTNINIGISDGNIVPSATIPIYWGQNFYSALGFNVFNTSKSTTLSGFPESRNSVNTQEHAISVSPIGYRNFLKGFGYYLDLSYNYRKTDRLEFGYLCMPDYLGGDWVAFENDVTFDIHSVYIETAVRYRTDNFFIRLLGALSPWQHINLRQNTMMKPIVADDANFKTSYAGGFSYQAAADIGYKLNRYLGIKAYLQYEFLPLKYDLELLNYNPVTSDFYFKQEEIDEENTKIIYGAMLFLPIVDTAGLSPSIGYEVREIYIKDKKAGGNSMNMEGLIKIGLTYNY